MQEFFRDQLEYNNYMNQQFIDYFRSQGGSVSDRCLKLLSHIVLVHKLWNHMITGGSPVTDWWKQLKLDEIATVNYENHRVSREIIESHELNETVVVPNPNGGTTDFILQDIVFHTINHSNYHRSQINSELRMIGLKPRKTDYIFYKAIKRAG